MNTTNMHSITKGTPIWIITNKDHWKNDEVKSVDANGNITLHWSYFTVHKSDIDKNIFLSKEACMNAINNGIRYDDGITYNVNDILTDYTDK